MFSFRRQVRKTTFSDRSHRLYLPYFFHLVPYRLISWVYEAYFLWRSPDATLKLQGLVVQGIQLIMWTKEFDMSQ